MRFGIVAEKRQSGGPRFHADSGVAASIKVELFAAIKYHEHYQLRQLMLALTSNQKSFATSIFTISLSLRT